MEPSDPQKNYIEFKERFRNMDDKELVDTYANDMRKPGWVSSRSYFLLALKQELNKRNITIPTIEKQG